MPRPRLCRSRLRERLFHLALYLKGLDAILEIVGGIALLLVSPAWIVRLVAVATQDELIEDPRDLVANFLRRWVQHLSVGTQHFAAAYLLAHGVVKIGLVVGLLTARYWAYPAAIVALALFVAYQLYRFTLTHAIGLIVFSAFDLVLIMLIWAEYRARSLRARRAAAAATAQNIVGSDQ